MGDKEDQSRRLVRLREDVLGLSQRALGKALGVSGGAVAMVETGRSKLSSRLLERLAERFSVNPAWLLEGREPICFETPPGFAGADGRTHIAQPAPGKPLPRDFAADGRDFSLVRVYDINLGAGRGIIPVDEGAETDLFAFPTGWLSRLGLAADVAALVRVKGDSMAPTIPDGAMVLVDLTKRSVDAPGVYAFSRDGEAFVKRLVPIEVGPSGRPSSLVVISDNPVIAPETVSGADLVGFNLVGQVRAVLFTV